MPSQRQMPRRPRSPATSTAIAAATPRQARRVSAPAGFRARTCERCEAVYMASPHAANRKYCDGCGPVALAEAKRRFDDRRYGRVASATRRRPSATSAAGWSTPARTPASAGPPAPALTEPTRQKIPEAWRQGSRHEPPPPAPPHLPGHAWLPTHGSGPASPAATSDATARQVNDASTAAQRRRAWEYARDALVVARWREGELPSFCAVTPWRYPSPTKSVDLVCTSPLLRPAVVHRWRRALTAARPPQATPAGVPRGAVGDREMVRILKPGNSVS